MKVAGLYDIHGNLPALDAVLDDVRRAGVDRIVVGGDVVPGPMPRETLRRLLDVNLPVQFVHGNGDLAVLAQMAATDPGAVTYWGTVSGQPLTDELGESLRWTARQLPPEYQAMIAGWPRTLRAEIPGLGPVLFCHATPRSETEVFGRFTAEDRLLPLFEDLGVSLVVCGHTHMQFDRMVGRTRVVNAGSVGLPSGDPGAFWVLLGPHVQLQCTSYDRAKAAEALRNTGYPRAHLIAQQVVEPPPAREMFDLISRHELAEGR
jgi:predicted phosphodiesterase